MERKKTLTSSCLSCLFSFQVPRDRRGAKIGEIVQFGLQTSAGGFSDGRDHPSVQQRSAGGHRIPAQDARA